MRKSKNKERSFLDDGFGFIEKKWQKKWYDSDIFKAKDNKGRKFYVLEMYPYPSSLGLHMGHAFNYTIGDIYARFKRMQGFNVLYPTGYDSFGLPAENSAIKEEVHPKSYTNKAISNFMKQQKSMGFSYDWSRVLWSHSPDYYKWNQFFFLKLLERGLVYRKRAVVNFCKKCNTVLANEQVHNGKCWRHKDTEVELKSLEQWFLKITDYAEELLNELDSLNWPEHIKVMQRNWIGKSVGYEITFEVNGKKHNIFTTRPDTIFGVSFLAVSMQHPNLDEFVEEGRKKEVALFLKKNMWKRDTAEKEGIFSGSYATNPLNGEKVPVWIANFVLSEYGSGIVMGVPAHDQRDFEFAKKYNLPIKFVICPKEKKMNSEDLKEAYTGEGILINSGPFDGLDSEEAKEHILKFLESRGLGKRSVQYKIRDWLISRQRYWGTPIPVIYCENCGIVPVPEKELPVILPYNVKFGKGNPLETNKKFLSVKCFKCKKMARRETDTMDTFLDSSWYYLRFCDTKNVKEPFSKKKVNFWMPVDQYIGGAIEHACMHLIYARFFTKVLRDMGFLNFGEPFKKLFGQGLVYGEDGYVMSKSRGNVVDPIEVSKKYGVDSLRMFLVSVASLDKNFTWSSTGLESVYKFLLCVVKYFEDSGFFLNKNKIEDNRTEHKFHKTLKEVTEHIENFQYNLAVIKIRGLFDYISRKKISRENAKIFVKMLSPFCPHLAEELWEKMGNKGFVSVEKWPTYDEHKISQFFDNQDKIVEEVIKDILNILKILRDKKKEVKKVFLYILPNEIDYYDKDEICFRVGKDIEIYSITDPKKYDPEGKSKKSKPGKPGIYIE
ncbi:MAG: leucine--tRNA ligase [Candidatus Pacearchaeota archaeon]